MEGRQPRDDSPWPPAASWVMGRSARWHTPQGQLLLAEDPLADDARDLRTALATSLSTPSAWPLVWAICASVRAVGRWRAIRRG